MKTENGNATRLLAILREGWRDGQANRNRPAHPDILSILIAECRRRYGDDEPARMAYMDGYCSGVESDSYALDIAKTGIVDGDYTETP